MPRTRLISIYFIVVNLLLFHLLLDLPREVAYQFKLYGIEWYEVGIFALAMLIVLAHLIAIGVSLALYGALKSLEALRLGRRFSEAVRPFELAAFLAFFYVNFIYFDIFVAHIQSSLLGGEVLLTRIKTALLLLAAGGAVLFFYRYKAGIIRFLENRLSTLGRVAKVSLVIALGLSTLRIAYKYEDYSCVNPSTAYLKPFADGQTGKQLPTIVVLTFDGLSAEHMSLYGYSRKTTTFLDEFAKTCTVFDNIRAVEQGTTSNLITFILGKRPKTWRTRLKAGFLHEQDKEENLLRVLETLGYSIRAIRGSETYKGFFNYHCPEILPGLRFQRNPNQLKGPWRFPLGALSMMQRMLDPASRIWISSIKYLHDSMWGRVRRGTWKVAGRPVPIDSPAVLRERMDQDLLLPFLEQELRYTREPVFLWIHEYIPHPPFNPPPPYFGRYLRSQENYYRLIEEANRNPDNYEVSKKLRARYDEYILYMDAGIAEVVKIIKGLKLLNQWILLISADHGAQSHNYFPNSSEEEAYHIPLIICAPGQAEGRRIQAAGGTLDFAPTILELIGVTPPAWMEGKSLVRFMGRTN